MRTLPIFATVAVAAVGAVACGSGQAATPAAVSDPGSIRAITATATGKAEGTPDLLTITIGVQTQAPRATAALADNNTKAAAVIAKLESGGVAAKDVQTSQLSVNPTYGPSGAVITGYQVSDLVTAKLRKLDGAGAVIDDAAAVAGDAARIQGITFSINDDSALLAQARADAVRQAAARAKAMADAAGVKLGRLRSVSDVSVQQPLAFNNVANSLAAGTSGGPSPVPVQPGTQELTVDVQVVYDIA
jgi:uncharacterized protein YggE